MVKPEIKAQAPNDPDFVNKVIDSLPPGRLGRLIDVSAASLTKFRRKGRFPVCRCASIEIATKGLYTRQMLRPDHFGDLDYDSDASLIDIT